MIELNTIHKTRQCRMVITFVLSCVSSYYAAAQQADYPIQAVPFTQVKFNDKFWLPRIRTNHTVTIPASFERCEATGRVKNFEMAAAKSGKTGRVVLNPSLANLAAPEGWDNFRSLHES